MASHIEIIDELVQTFEKKVISSTSSTTANIDNNNKITNNSTSNKININDHKPNIKHKNGNIITQTKIQQKNNTSSIIDDNKQNDDDDDKLNDDDNPNIDDLSEEEALKLAMEMSMNDDDKKLISNISHEISEAQSLLSSWFNGNYATVRDKNRGWCKFVRRLHHKFEMYRIENGIIQPLNYQFFIQFIAMMYGMMKQNQNQNQNQNDNELYIDQHKIKKITLLSSDDIAIKYLRFKSNIDKKQLSDAIYVKFESLALDPMHPNEWKWNHVMFVKSDKAPNGLLWTKWHMQ